MWLVNIHMQFDDKKHDKCRGEDFVKLKKYAMEILYYGKKEKKRVNRSQQLKRVIYMIIIQTTTYVSNNLNMILT